MKDRTVGIIGTVVVVAIIVALAVIVQSAAPKPLASPTLSPSPTASVAARATGSPQASATATIVYNDNGFSPAQTTVNAGQTITFTNQSSEQIQVDSDPHPVHTDDPQLNVGVIGAGQSKTVTVTTKGSFGIHNHLEPTVKAHVTIQ